MRLAGSEIDIYRLPLAPRGPEAEAEVWMPPNARAVVICAHGGSDPDVIRLRHMAHELTQSDFGVVLIDAAESLGPAIDALAEDLNHRGVAIGLLATEKAATAAAEALGRRPAVIRTLVLLGDLDTNEASSAEQARRRFESHLTHRAFRTASGN